MSRSVVVRRTTFTGVALGVVVSLVGLVIALAVSWSSGLSVLGFGVFVFAVSGFVSLKLDPDLKRK